MKTKVHAVAVVLTAVAAGCSDGVSHIRQPRTSAPAGVHATTGVGAQHFDREAVAAGYYERLRLGLGSPFRLLDQVRLDPRLTAEQRSEVGRELLHRTADGAAYVIDVRAFTIAGPPHRPWSGNATAHLQLIEHAIASAATPDVGLLSVRVAYELAAAERTVTPELSTRAALAATLLRDRQLARADARRLEQYARRAGSEAHEVVRDWRAQNRFLVEQPPPLTLAPEDEQKAVQLARLLLGGVRAAAWSARTTPDTTIEGRFTWPAAVGLQAAAQALGNPPHPAVTLTTLTMAKAFGGSAGRAAAATQFAVDVRTEEELVAQLVTMRDSLPAGFGAITALHAAVALRAFAQEQPWFVGMPGPPTAELEQRYSLKTVRFSDDIPESWQPFYRAAVARALDDMRLVLPGFVVSDLQLRFTRGTDGIAESLASHDPQSRSIYLPVNTGLGAVAHELAHDLDRQMAERDYGVTRTYATDYAARTAAPLAAVVTRLAAARDADKSSQPERPTEIFARQFDWLIATALAAQGRSNGYLTTVQSEWLPGFASARRPAGVQTDALLRLVGRATWLANSAHEQLRRTALNATLLSPFDVLTAFKSQNRNGGWSRLETIDSVHARISQAIDRQSCALSPLQLSQRPALQQLVSLAAAAHARGVIIDAAGESGAHLREALAAELYGLPNATAEAPQDVALFRSLVPSFERAQLPRPNPGFLLSSGCNLLHID